MTNASAVNSTAPVFSYYKYRKRGAESKSR